MQDRAHADDQLAALSSDYEYCTCSCCTIPVALKRECAENMRFISRALFIFHVSYDSD